MYPRKGQIDKARFQKAMEAKAFFLRFLNADCDRVAIENPRPLKIVELPKKISKYSHINLATRGVNSPIFG